MDIVSLAHVPGEDAGSCTTTVVYINNGATFEDIIKTMKPEFNNKPSVYWMIQDIYEWQGILDCVMTVRLATGEEWN
jgi:hypothetical protein